MKLVGFWCEIFHRGEYMKPMGFDRRPFQNERKDEIYSLT